MLIYLGGLYRMGRESGYVQAIKAPGNQPIQVIASFHYEAEKGHDQLGVVALLSDEEPPCVSSS